MSRLSRLTTGISIAVLATALTACGSSKSGSGGSVASDPADPTGTPIVIGTLESQTGAAAGPTKVATDTMTAWVKWTNANGGINGHPVKLVTANDNADPAQAQTELTKQIEQDKIVALVGQSSITTQPTWEKLTSDAKLPVIGGAAYSSAWFTNPYFYPSTTTVLSDVWANSFITKKAGLKTQAVLQCNNATVCLGALPLIKDASADVGIDLVYVATASQSATDYTPQCLAMKESGAESVAASVNNQLLARNCGQQGYRPAYLFADTTTSLSQLKATPEFDGGLGYTSSFPWWQEFPETADYFSAMKKYAPDYMEGGSKRNLMTSNGTAAWAGAVVFANAVKNANIPADQPVTRETVVKGLSMIKDSTNGGYTPPVTYGDGTTPNAQVTCFWINKVEKSQWVSDADGMKTYCQTAK